MPVPVFAGRGATAPGGIAAPVPAGVAAWAGPVGVVAGPGVRTTKAHSEKCGTSKVTEVAVLPTCLASMLHAFVVSSRENIFRFEKSPPASARSAGEKSQVIVTGFWMLLVAPVFVLTVISNTLTARSEPGAAAKFTTEAPCSGTMLTAEEKPVNSPTSPATIEITSSAPSVPAAIPMVAEMVSMGAVMFAFGAGVMVTVGNPPVAGVLMATTVPPVVVTVVVVEPSRFVTVTLVPWPVVVVPGAVCASALPNEPGIAASAPTVSASSPTTTLVRAMLKIEFIASLPATYQATTTLLVVQRQAEGTVNLTDIQTAERLANTFSRLVTIRPVMEQAISDGHLPFSITELEDLISVRNPPTTQLLEVSARTSDGQLAATIANSVATAFISSNQANLSNRPGLVSVVERAEPPLFPVSPRKTVNAALGAVALLAIAVGVVLLIEYLDDTVKTPEQASEISGLPALGRIEQFDRTRTPRDQLQAAHRPRSTVAEAYRAARTNLSYAIDLGRDRRLVLVTSPGPGEGKTTTVANLAVVFGLAGHRVCVVDTDLRRPTLHRLFGLDNQEGLTNLLLAREPDLDRAIQRTVYTNVSAVTSGPLPPNPSELLGSARMQEVLERLKSRFDVVLLDSPPALVVTDASVLATLADGLLIVTRAHHTRTQQLAATVEELAQSGRPIAGIIINRVASRDAYYYYGTGYGRAYGEVPDHDAAAERLRVSDLTTTAEAPATTAVTASTTGSDGAASRLWSGDAPRQSDRESAATVVVDDDDLDHDLDQTEDGSPHNGRDRGV